MRRDNYNDPKPCPYCGFPCHADFVDIEVGMLQCGPYFCENCGASQIGPYDDTDLYLFNEITNKTRILLEKEKQTGWYLPNGRLGNTVNIYKGKYITHQQAEFLYKNGEIINEDYHMF